MAIVLGKDWNLFVNTGSYGSPTWTELTNCKDLTFNQTADEVDSTTRATSGYKTTEPTLKGLEVSWTSNWDTADTQLMAIHDAFHAGTSKELGMTSAATMATSGARIFRAEFKFTVASIPQPLAGISEVQVTAKPCASSNAPAWSTVS